MIVLVIVVLLLIGLIGGAVMCDVMMADGCMETLFAFILGALASIAVAVGFGAMLGIIIVEVF